MWDRKILLGPDNFWKIRNQRPSRTLLRGYEPKKFMHCRFFIFPSDSRPYHVTHETDRHEAISQHVFFARGKEITLTFFISVETCILWHTACVEGFHFNSCHISLCVHNSSDSCHAKTTGLQRKAWSCTVAIINWPWHWVWVVEPRELPPLNINAMAPVSMQYILKICFLHNMVQFLWTKSFELLCHFYRRFSGTGVLGITPLK